MSINSHIVPQRYLKYFRIENFENSIYCFQKVSAKWNSSQSSIENICKNKHIYELKLFTFSNDIKENDVLFQFSIDKYFSVFPEFRDFCEKLLEPYTFFLNSSKQTNLENKLLVLIRDNGQVRDSNNNQVRKTKLKSIIENEWLKKKYNYFIETKLSVMENKCFNTIDYLKSINPLSLPSKKEIDNCDDINSLIAFQEIRDYRKTIYGDYIRKNIFPLFPKEVNTPSSELQYTKIVLMTFLSGVKMRGIESLVESTMSLSFILFKSTDGEFVTSDNPILLLKNKSFKEQLIFLPLTPNLCLAGFNGKGIRKNLVFFSSLSKKYVNYLNFKALDNCNEYILAKNKVDIPHFNAIEENDLFIDLYKLLSVLCNIV